MKKEEVNKRGIRFPISVKAILMVIIFGLILAETAMVFFTLASSKDHKEAYKSNATKLATTVSLSIDKAKTKAVKDKAYTIYENSSKPGREKEGTAEHKAYLALFDEVRAMEEYVFLKAYLLSIKNANPETDGIYLAFVDYTAAKSIYIVYDEENEVYPVGMIDDIYEEDMDLIKDPMRGFLASIYVEETTGVTLVTAGVPVLDQSNQIICYCLVDITMATVRSKQANSIVMLFVFLVSTVLLLSILGFVMMHFIFIKPIKKLQNAAKTYDVEHPEETHEAFEKLYLRSNDEFRDLSEAMKGMENDLHSKINELTDAYASLLASKKAAGELEVLATTDALTGTLNKIAFDTKTMKMNASIENKEEISFGIVMVDLNDLKPINDQYGHDAGNKALINLVALLSSCFPDVLVYRVGGDEFVLILEGEVLRKAKTYIANFDAKIDALSKDGSLTPMEKCSAAIGYSEFDPKIDRYVDDVFKRADKAMYVRKRRMKGNRPK